MPDKILQFIDGTAVKSPIIADPIVQRKAETLATKKALPGLKTVGKGLGVAGLMFDSAPQAPKKANDYEFQTGKKQPTLQEIQSAFRKDAGLDKATAEKPSESSVKKIEKKKSL